MNIKGRLAKFTVETERPFGLRQGEIEETLLEKIFIDPAELPKERWGYTDALEEAAKLDGLADGVNDADYGHESIDVYFDRIDVEVEEGVPGESWVLWDAVSERHIKRPVPDESKREEVFFE